MLLTTKQIISFINENGDFGDQKEIDRYEYIFEELLKSKELKNLKMEALFENFDMRMQLAKSVKIFFFLIKIPLNFFFSPSQNFFPLQMFPSQNFSFTNFFSL